MRGRRSRTRRGAGQSARSRGGLAARQARRRNQGLAECMKPVSGNRICKELERRGWILLRINGSHHIYGRPNWEPVRSDRVCAAKRREHGGEEGRYGKGVPPGGEMTKGIQVDSETFLRTSPGCSWSRASVARSASETIPTSSFARFMTSSRRICLSFISLTASLTS